MRDLLPNIPQSALYAVPTLLMFVAFSALLVWVCRKSGREALEKGAQIPFSDLPEEAPVPATRKTVR